MMECMKPKVCLRCGKKGFREITVSRRRISICRYCKDRKVEKSN